MNQILRISTFTVLYVQCVIFQFYSFVIVPQMIGIITVCQQLAVVAIELVDALFFRITRGTDKTESPFAESAGLVSCVLEIVEDGLCICR